jgi:hypothetical protein
VAKSGYKYIQASWQKEIFSVDIFQGTFFGVSAQGPSGASPARSSAHRTLGITLDQKSGPLDRCETNVERIKSI